MVTYRRAREPGACYFFTVALADRRSALLAEHVEHLGRCLRAVRRRHPFTMDAFVILPDHLHCLWTLPAQDADFSTRWFLIKSAFSRGLAATDEHRETSRVRRRERGIWQRRFWEHQIRDDRDFAHHVAYIHINPVKHGFADRANEWPHSSIHRHVREGLCDPGWAAEPFVLAMEFE